MILVHLAVFLFLAAPCNAFIRSPKSSNFYDLEMQAVRGAISDNELAEVFNGESVTIIGFGSLLSETSSRGTFPNLQNFREVHVKDYARKYQHPAFIFFKRGIADLEAKTYASLSTEPCQGAGFMAVAFEIEGESKEAWLAREEEFEFHYADCVEGDGLTTRGVMCCAPSVRDDSIYIERWGQEKYEKSLEEAGLHGIWDRKLNEGILPCSVYLRHCVLACRQSRSQKCLDSFLDKTQLEDGSTVREYLEKHPEVMDLQPPESLIGRYSG